MLYKDKFNGDLEGKVQGKFEIVNLDILEYMPQDQQHDIVLGIDSNSIGESVLILMIFYWLNNYLIIKYIYEYIFNR